jgi:saccharopine dehydrogenase (NAD+, L-lysine-forming)
MNLLGIHEVEPDEFISKDFSYPVYVHLKGADLYAHQLTNTYNRVDFHKNPQNYKSLFPGYLSQADILMNGIYWEKNIPRLFEIEDLQRDNFRIKTITDISDDINGSVPCNFGNATIENPVYGVDRTTMKITEPYLPDSVDVIAVGNLPNELPKDASGYFGEQLIKYILNDIRIGGTNVINHATIVNEGRLTSTYEYMREYAEG